MKRTIIVIPSLEPDDKLLKLLSDIRKRDKETPVLIVNDGSGPEYNTIFSEAETEYQCLVLRHEVNRGKGAALKTAIRYVLEQLPLIRYMVTIDSDGQHSYEDMMNCMTTAYRSGDVLVLGTRNFEKDVPLRSKFGNILTRNVLHLATGIKVTDTQTGLRVIPRSFMERLLHTEGERFEFETNMLIDAKKNRVPIVSQQIATIYLEDNKSSHFRVIADSLRIYGVFLKYLLSSASCFFVDIALFLWLTALPESVFPFGANRILVATVIARVASSLLNYFINRNLVFYGTSRSSIIKYFGLVVIQMLASAYLVVFLTALVPVIPTGWIKIFVDGGLFLVSYQVQRKYIF